MDTLASAAYLGVWTCAAQQLCRSGPYCRGGSFRQRSAEAWRLRGQAVGGLLRHVPAALLVVATGLVVTVAQYPSVLRALRLGPRLPTLAAPTGRQWATGARGVAPKCPHRALAVSCQLRA